VSKREIPAEYRPDDPTEHLTRGGMRLGTRRVVRLILLGLFRITMGLRIEGLDRVPASGPMILISNHLHNLDPLITESALKRNCHFFTKQEAFTYPIIRNILRWGGGFPVDRGTPDRWAIRRAEALLEAGIAVGVYPEGTRSTTLALQKGFSGAGLIALRSRAPIVPSIITGSERLPFNGKKGKLRDGITMPNPGHKGVRVRFGEPFTIPAEINGKRVGAAEATDLMMIELAKMLPPDYRGVYADRINEGINDRPTVPASEPTPTPE
jgi:1-acyl-sn-glycerol-3-phosphate acyltransferase